MDFALIAVNYPLKNAGLVYSFEGPLQRGDVVEVPLGKRVELGCVLRILSLQSPEIIETPVEKIKKVTIKIESWALTESELVLFEWMAQYYHYSLGRLIFDCLPNRLKRPRPLENIQSDLTAEKIIPNEAQKKIIDSIINKIGSFHRFLIHGVTGSGKTVVYQGLMEEVFKKNKSVLFLLPEINLTPQFIKTFSMQMNVPILSYHSELSDSQKYQIWKMARELDRPYLILGVRSSVFAPIANLGLIIIDEEHDNSFKQDDRCPYNARDVAIKKAQILDIPIILGSATPSVETYHAFHQDQLKQNRFELRERAGEAFLPAIELIDSRNKEERELGFWPLSNRSVDLIQEALSRGEQVLVFINRLGFSSYVQCRACGSQFNCPNCSITLKYYKQKSHLACHHCEYKESLPSQCPSCGCLTIIQKGFGTEKVQEVLTHIFPDKVIERFDREEIKNLTELEKRMNEFHSGNIDILVGTQMLSKGHNFEKVKFVLILGIDSQMNFPDFRSMERVYQTLTQVSGRAGRYSQDGKVGVQTNSPENFFYNVITKHEFDSFYTNEIEMRKLCDCPPYKRLVAIHFSSRFQDKLISYVTLQMAPLFKNLIKLHFGLVHLLGPRPAAIEKKSNQFTWTILLKSENLSQLHNLLKSFELNCPKISSITYKIDVDPYNLG